MISVLYVTRPPGRDGIRDFSQSLTTALSALPGTDAQLVLWHQRSGWPAALEGSSSIVLQYNPFSYGRGGFAPWLVAQLARRRDSAKLCLMIHEPYVPIENARSAAMGAWQRVQLRALLRLAEAVGLSAEGFRSYLPARHRARARHMPVGSPLPDARHRRIATRASLGANDSDLVLALYGSSDADRLIDCSLGAIAAIGATDTSAIVLNLGFAAPVLEPPPGALRMIRPGPLPPSELAAHLAAADVALLPFVDGASTRRTTMIASLQQGTCVLSTRGVLTDRELARAPSPILTPVGDLDAFARAAVHLAADRALRERTAAQGRELFDTVFDWPLVAQRVVGALTGPSASWPARCSGGRSRTGS